MSPTGCTSSPSVIVYLPARNEEHNITQCLDSLLYQSYDNYRIVVIDDDSTDQTAEIVTQYSTQHNHVHLLQLKEKPEGWIGKTYALHEGIQTFPDAEWYLFIDADVTLFPDSISKALHYAREQASDMLSGIGQHSTLSFGEKLLQPILQLMFYIKFPAEQVNHPESSLVNAIGQFILIKRDTYLKIGGYPAIKNDLIDDIALAKLVKTHGYRLFFLLDCRLYKVRMYRSLKEAWLGWKKNIFLACHSSVRETMILPLSLTCLLWLPLLLAAIEVEFRLFFLFVEVYYLYKIANIYKQIGFSLLYLLWIHVSSLLLVVLCLDSVYSHKVTKRVMWKERIYQLKDLS